MSSQSDDFVTIRPRRAPLAHVPADATVDAASATRRLPLAWLGFAALLALAIWVLFFMPAPVVEPPPRTPGVEQSAAPRAADATPAPFEDLQRKRARDDAQALLSRFVELQIRLDDEMQVTEWAPEEFEAAQRAANDGDQRFLKENYEAAMAAYRSGIDGLEALVARGQATFDDNLAAGLTALARGDAPAALAALDTAAIVHPGDPRLAAARHRAEVLPEVVELTRRAEIAAAKGDAADAIDAYTRALALDPTRTDLEPQIAELRATQADRAFAARLTTGFDALDAGNLDRALDAFRAALRDRPNDQAARDGLAQVEQAQTLARIESTRRHAVELEAAEDWPAAAAAYGDVLAIDPTIQFATEGRARAEARIQLDQRLRDALSDPGALSADAVFQNAVALYDEAVDIAAPGAKLTAQLDRLESMIAVAAQPTTVVLTSDAATDVSVYQLGNIGRFERKEVSLRPGRYLVTGSRPGRRDVRFEMLVTPGMAPVDVRCSETI